MSGLAHILLKMGRKVSGSDLSRARMVEKLESGGAVCYQGHRAENIDSPDLVVISTAIPRNNPELLEAEKKGIPVIHRGDLLAMLMLQKKGIAICGAHGKTTTTSMMAAVLEKTGFDPTILIGGELPEIGGNAKLGSGEYLVAEADESDGSFLKLVPHVAVVTNIEDDHLDFYGNMSEVENAFKNFIDNVKSDGFAVACLDDPGVGKIINRCKGKSIVTYSLMYPAADYFASEISFNGKGTGGHIYFRERYLGYLNLLLPGRHNLTNALAVAATACSMGIPFRQVSEVLQSFCGAGRRFQLLGDINEVKVVDDYAHHPTEVEATLQAARQLKPRRVVSVFQPHRYSRTALLYERFGSVFYNADEVIINEIYGAGEKPLESVNSNLIVRSLNNNGVNNVKYFREQDEIVQYLLNSVSPGDMVLTMGAGNIWNVSVEFVKRLKEKTNDF